MSQDILVLKPGMTQKQQQPEIPESTIYAKIIYLNKIGYSKRINLRREEYYKNSTEEE